MARRAPKLCADPLCTEVVPAGQRHCEDHKREPWRTMAPTASAVASNDPNWPTIRRRILEHDGHRCQLRGPRCVVVATHVDHIIEAADGGDNSDGNLQAACEPCHRSKTGKDARARQLGTGKHAGRSDGVR